MIPEQIKEARQELGLTQSQFAEALGFSRHATVSNWETGKQAMDETAAKLLRVYLDGYRPSDWPK